MVVCQSDRRELSSLQQNEEPAPLNWLIYREIDHGHADITVHVETKEADHWIGWISHDVETEVVACGKFPYGWNAVLANWKVERIYVGKYLPEGEYIV